MSIVNGIIQAPVNVTDVSETLGVNIFDVGRLCTHDYLNMWSKYKPVWFSVPAPADDDEWWKASYPTKSGLYPIGAKDGDYGIQVGPWSAEGDTMVDKVRTVIAKYASLDGHIDKSDGTIYSVSSLEKDINLFLALSEFWSYRYSKPTGAFMYSAYRLGDFRGYNHICKSPEWIDEGQQSRQINVSIPQTQSLDYQVNFVDDADYPNNITIDNLKDIVYSIGSGCSLYILWALTNNVKILQSGRVEVDTEEDQAEFTVPDLEGYSDGSLSLYVCLMSVDTTADYPYKYYPLTTGINTATIPMSVNIYSDVEHGGFGLLSTWRGDDLIYIFPTETQPSKVSEVPSAMMKPFADMGNEPYHELDEYWVLNSYTGRFGIAIELVNMSKYTIEVNRNTFAIELDDNGKVTPAFVYDPDGNNLASKSYKMAEMTDASFILYPPDDFLDGVKSVTFGELKIYINGVNQLGGENSSQYIYYVTGGTTGWTTKEK